MKIDTKGTTAKTSVQDTEDTEVIEQQALVVFDAGSGNTMSLSDCQFVDGIFITDKPAEIKIVQNFIAQTGSRWAQEDFDPSNPRHVRVGQTQVPLVVQGISDPISGKPSALTSSLLAGDPIKPAIPPLDTGTGAGAGATGTAGTDSISGGTGGTGSTE